MEDVDQLKFLTKKLVSIYNVSKKAQTHLHIRKKKRPAKQNVKEDHVLCANVETFGGDGKRKLSVLQPDKLFIPICFFDSSHSLSMDDMSVDDLNENRQVYARRRRYSSEAEHINRDSKAYKHALIECPEMCCRCRKTMNDNNLKQELLPSSYTKTSEIITKADGGAKSNEPYPLDKINRSLVKTSTSLTKTKTSMTKTNTPMDKTNRRLQTASSSVKPDRRNIAACKKLLEEIERLDKLSFEEMELHNTNMQLLMEQLHHQSDEIKELNIILRRVAHEKNLVTREHLKTRYKI